MPVVRVTETQDVGEHTVALELETPADFEAFPGQFIAIKSEINGQEETGYYTISSPTVEDSFEITVSYHPEGVLGTWLANRQKDDKVSIEGPLGNTKYLGESDVIAIAEGPGIGPAIAIAERGLSNDRKATIIFQGESPPHQERLDSVEKSNGSVDIVDEADNINIRDRLLPKREIFVFGFENFVKDIKSKLDKVGSGQNIHIENFGPKGS